MMIRIQSPETWGSAKRRIVFFCLFLVVLGGSSPQRPHLWGDLSTLRPSPNFGHSRRHVPFLSRPEGKEAVDW